MPPESNDQNNQSPTNNPQFVQPTTPQVPPQPSQFFQQDTPSIVATPPQQPKPKSKKWIILLIAILVLIIGAAAAYFLFIRKDTKDGQSNSIPSSIDDSKDSSGETGKLKMTTFTKGKVSVSMEHPVDWTVDEKSETYEGWDGEQVTEKSMNIVSPSSGFTLHIGEGGGGGGCPELVPYQLTKRLKTKTENTYISQYSYLGEPTPKPEPLIIENTDDESDEIKNAKEGDRVDGCIMTAYNYSYVDTNHYDGFSVSIIKNENGDGLAYEDIQTDPEFFAMLQSLSFSGGN